MLSVSQSKLTLSILVEAGLYSCIPGLSFLFWLLGADSERSLQVRQIKYQFACHRMHLICHLGGVPTHMHVHKMHVYGCAAP